MRNFLLGVAATLIVVGGLYLWGKTRDPLPSVLAPPSKELANAPTDTLTCKPVIVYRDKVEKALGLPETVTRDTDKHVVASSPVPASDYPHTMTAVYDQGTGGVDMFLRRDPMPWVAAVTRYNLGLYYGARTDADALVARLVASGEFLQLKRLNLGGTVSVDADGQAYGGVGISIRF